MERTDGLWSALSHASVYSLLQDALGARRSRRRLVDEFIRPTPGMRILDVGCGPADILEALPDVRYVGVDWSQAYIDRARERFGERGVFLCGDVQSEAVGAHGPFDLALAIGLLHHLDDASAALLLETVKATLAPDGRVFFIDPVFEPRQNPVARVLVSLDRGRNVRTERDYAALLRSVLPTAQTHVRRDLLNVPYTHILAEAWGRPSD